MSLGSDNLGPASLPTLQGEGTCAQVTASLPALQGEGTCARVTEGLSDDLSGIQCS